MSIPLRPTFSANGYQSRPTVADLNEIIAAVNDVPDTVAASIATAGSDVRAAVFATMPFWNIEWSGATAYADGTAYASMTDSAAEIQAAIDYAESIGVPVVGRGTYRVDSTITIDCNADFGGATFVCNDDSINPLVRIGTATADEIVLRILVTAPRVIQEANTSSGWTGASVGINLHNLSTSEVTIPYVEEFTTGVLVSAESTGCAYNMVRIIHLYNNKQNLVLAPQDATAWVNENTFIGGRFAFDSGEGTAVADTRHVLLETLTGGNIINNNRFLALSLEGNVPEYHVELIGAANNVFEYCRWEATTPRLWYNVTGDGVGSTDNMLFGGYKADQVDITDTDPSTRNYAWVRSRMEFSGDIITGNGGSSASPALYLLSAGDSAQSVTHTTEYLTAFGGQFWLGKRKTDTEPRVRINTNNAYIELGPGGVTAPDVLIRRLAANVAGTDTGDKWVANAGLGVGNSAAATTLGTVTKKIEVFDATGASLGFVAVYDAIT